MQEFICKYQEIVTYWLRGRDCLSGVTCFSFCEKYVRDVFLLLFASLNLQCKCKQKKGWTQKEKSSIMGLTRTQRKDDS